MSIRDVFIPAVLGCLVLVACSHAADPAPKVDLYGDPLPSGAVSRLGTARFRQHGELISTSYLADGKALIGVSTDVVYAWDAQSGELLQTLPIEEQYVQHAAFAGNRQRVVTSGSHFDEADRASHYSLKIWNLTELGEVATIELTRETRPSCIAINADGTLVATGGNRGTVRIFEVASGTELLSYEVSDREVKALAFSPNDKRLLVSVRNQPLRIWHWAGGGMPEFLEGRHESPPAFEWSRNGDLIAVAHYGPEGVHLLDGESGELLDKLAQGPFFGSVRMIAFSPEDRLLATYDVGTRNIAIWDVETRELVRPLDCASLRIGQITFSPDGKRVAAARSNPATVFTWDVDTGEASKYANVGHQAVPTSVAFLPGDQTIVTSGDDGTLRWWDAGSGKQFRVSAHRPEDTGAERVTLWIRAMDVSPNGRLIATSSQDNTDRIWNAATGDEIHRLPGHGRTGGRRAARFSPDGNQLMTWGDDMCIRIWDTNTGKMVVEHAIRPSGIEIPENEDGTVDFDSGDDWNMTLGFGAFSADGSRFVIGFDGGQAYLYDVDSGRELMKLDLGAANANSVAIAPDGKTMLAGCAKSYVSLRLKDGSTRFARPDEFYVRLLTLPDGEELQRWSFVGRWAGPVVFGPDGAVFAVGSPRVGEPIRVYDTRTGSLRAEIRGFNGYPWALAFSHDGNLLASSLSSGSVLIWDWKQLIQ